MKRVTILVLLALTIGWIVYYKDEVARWIGGRKEETSELNKLKEKKTTEPVQDGDIIFQTSMSSQSEAIQLATKSKYSHMGIIQESNGEFYVYEAAQLVKLTPLDQWIKRGTGGHYVIKRLANAGKILTKETLTRLRESGDKFNGKGYDVYFEWSDDRIYCSELVWKIYQDATGIEIGELQKLKEFDLTSHVVKNKMRERYGDSIPLEEKVISPAAIFNSDKLITVIEH